MHYAAGWLAWTVYLSVSYNADWQAGIGLVNSMVWETVSVKSRLFCGFEEKKCRCYSDINLRSAMTLLITVVTSLSEELPCELC